LYSTIIIYINNNNNTIINNYGRLQDLILLFKIPMGMGENFLEIYTQFGHEPSKRFASPGLYTIFYKGNKQMNNNTNTDTTAIASARFHISYHTVLRVETIFG